MKTLLDLVLINKSCKRKKLLNTIILKFGHHYSCKLPMWRERTASLTGLATSLRAIMAIRDSL